CPCDDFGQAGDVVDLHCPLRDCSENGTVVDFLERLAALHVGPDLPDENEHGRTVLHGGVDADGGVCRAGTARDKADSWRTGQLSVGGRHESRAAFVTAEDEVKLTPRVMQGVQHSEVALAGHAETLARTEGNERLDQHPYSVPR